MDFIEKAIKYLYAPEMEILYDFEQTFRSKAIDEENDELSVFEVIDNSVDKTIPEGANLYEGDKPPEKEGFIGLTLSDDSLVRSDGTSPNEPVHVWVREEDLIPDFSSFTGKHKI